MTSFNFFYDIQFWLFFVLIVIAIRTFTIRFDIRNVLLLIANCLMLLALPQFSLSKFFLLISVSFVIYFIGSFLNRKEVASDKSKRFMIAFFAISTVIAMLSFFKYAFIQKFFRQEIFNQSFSASHYIFFIGISYSSFKMIHFLIEGYKQKLSKLRLIDFFNYIFFFTSFISGPINRYNHFVKQIAETNDTRLRADLKSGIERIIHGLFKKFVLCTILYPYASATMQGAVSELSGTEIFLGLYAHTLYFYFDFSGYTDIAIGTARILGINLPENFNYPFFKKNIQQLWANWHMTLTGWLTDYVYWPLSKKLRKFGFFKRRPVLLSNVSIIVTFIICGMWHGETFNFILWGAYHGVGLATLNVYQRQKRKISSPFMRNYFKSKYSEIVGIVGTFHFFVFGLILFSLKTEQIKNLLLRVL